MSAKFHHIKSAFSSFQPYKLVDVKTIMHSPLATFHHLRPSEFPHSLTWPTGAEALKNRRKTEGSERVMPPLRNQTAC